MLCFDRSDDDMVAELAGYVAIPSVSRDASPATMAEAADWLVERLGFAGARIEPTDGHPVVRGEWAGAPGAPTVLVYGHYDVQPTGSLTEWLSPPFELTVDGPTIRGRGATDDKGPVYVVLEVLRAFMDQEGALPLNVKLLLEGEEEVGSPHLPAYVEAHADELAADLVISADGAMWRPDEPSLSLSSKGLVSMDIVVSGATDDLHSGRYGGTVANPAEALCRLVASLHGADGSIAVEGFLDGIPPLSDHRRTELDAVAWDDATYRRQLGLDELHGEPGRSTIERLWERPTIEVNGLTAGGKYTVIPHQAVAHVSCRLVPGQDPDRAIAAVVDHVATHRPAGVRAEVRVDDARIPAYTIPADHPAIRAGEAALGHVYPDRRVLLACIAGTLPATALFERVLGTKTLFFSFSTADERLHAPNEYMRTARLREGMLAWEHLLRSLADGPHRLEPVTR